MNVICAFARPCRSTEPGAFLLFDLPWPAVLLVQPDRQELLVESPQGQIRFSLTAGDLLQGPVCVYPSQSRPSTWAGSLEGVSQAKRMQIEAIAGDRNAFGPSRCAQVMRVIHPLLSQPIVEHALGQSLMALTEGRRDRAMARAAFANRLPAALIERRGKGSLSYFFGQTLARSVPILRTRLLEGALAQAGLVDRTQFEHVLDPDQLVQSSCYGEIIRLLIVERWMRGWQERLQQPRQQPALLPRDYPIESRSPEHRNPGDLQGCR